MSVLIGGFVAAVIYGITKAEPMPDQDARQPRKNAQIMFGIVMGISAFMYLLSRVAEANF